MKRQIFNPFNEQNTAGSSAHQQDNIEARAFSVENPDTCPKCNSKLVDAAVGGHGDVDQSQVKYCTKCRVVIPVKHND